jgi:putative transposase
MDLLLSLRHHRYLQSIWVGWMIAPSQTGALAEELISQTCSRQEIEREQLSIYSDRGGPMTSKAVALLLSDLGVTKSLNRPYLSDDNPYSESQFKTLKSRPTFPDKFGSIENARAWCQDFFKWYNNEHYHGDYALMTPATVHYGRAQGCNTRRQKTLSSAHEQYPERFVKGQPTTLILPNAAWINQPPPLILSSFAPLAVP